MEFSPSNLGVIICSHVFEVSRPILLVAHDADGWNFACGANDHGDDDFHNVGVGHLTSRDPSINGCADLQCGYIAERKDENSPWARESLPSDGLQQFVPAEAASRLGLIQALGRTRFGRSVKMNYTALALSYREWHHQMTPVAWEHMDPALGLAAFHATNVFSLLMLAPVNSMPALLFALIPVSCGAAFAWYIGRIYGSRPAPPTHAKLSDSVPGVSQFPLVYAYLFGTLLLFVACLYVAVRGAA